MPLQIADVLSVAPGQSVGSGVPIPATSTAVVSYQAVGVPVGRVVAYVYAVVAIPTNPSGFTVASLVSVPLTGTSVAIRPLPYPATYGPFYIRIYAIKGSNYPTLTYTVSAD